MKALKTASIDEPELRPCGLVYINWKVDGEGESGKTVASPNTRTKENCGQYIRHVADR